MVEADKAIADIDAKAGTFYHPECTPIAVYIDNLQEGHQGIYPGKVALHVCAKFGIVESEATEYVSAHIKRVLAESK
jgi:hypothetical protein